MENEKSIRDLWPENMAEALPENPFHKKEHQSLLVVFQTSSTVKRLNENLEAKKAGFEYFKQELKEIQEQAIQFEENYSAVLTGFGIVKNVKKCLLMNFHGKQIQT